MALNYIDMAFLNAEPLEDRIYTTVLLIYLMILMRTREALCNPSELVGKCNSRFVKEMFLNREADGSVRALGLLGLSELLMLKKLNELKDGETLVNEVLACVSSTHRALQHSALRILDVNILDIFPFTAFLPHSFALLL